MKKFQLSLLVVPIVVLAACDSKPQAVSFNCEYEPISIKTTNQGIVDLPKVGLLVEESHYLTASDLHIDGYPKTETEGIEEHLQESCNFLSIPCEQLYKKKWEKVWTPSEGGGNIGGNAREQKPPLVEEIFQGNMMFAKGYLPKAGEKWLVRNPANGKAVVISVGREIGPGSAKFLGGISVEAHYFLQSGNETKLEIGKLKDQEADFGPRNCK